MFVRRRAFSRAVTHKNHRGYTTDAQSSRKARDIEKKLPPHLQERVRKRDHIIKATAKEALVAVINNTNMVETARQKHNLSSTTTRLLGKAMAGVALMSSLHKGDERIHAQWTGVGGVRTVAVEAMSNGEVRGYVNPPDFYMPPNTPLGFAMKGGTLEIIKVLYGGARPYRSVVELAGADIVSDLEMYFKISEQTPTLFDLETYLRADGSVRFSGGVFVQALPGSEGSTPMKQAEKVIEEYRDRMRHLPPLSVLFTEDANHLREVVMKIAPGEIDESTLTKIPTDFYCRCSKDRFKYKLLTLGKAELQKYFQMHKEHPEESDLVCVYCNSRYTLDENDINELMEACK